MEAVILKAQGDLTSALHEAARRIFSVCTSQPSDAPLVVGLCGGRSVVGLLGALHKESANQPKELLGRIQFFMVDERLVPLSDENSNYGGLKRLLFDSLIEQKVISEGQLHPFVTDSTQSDYGCGTYREELQRFGGRFTVVVLGIGEDGHVAGLFPGHAALKESQATFLNFHDSPKPPADRMTASSALVTGAGLALVLALGEGKRAAWEAFQRPGTPTSECPAKLALQASGCIVVTDLS